MHIAKPTIHALSLGILFESWTDLFINPNYLEDDMTVVIARLFPRASATSIANIDSFATVALFSGLGLLLSLSVLILDQYIPGEWF